MSGILKRFWKDQSGAYAIMMGIATIPLLLGVGTAVDYGRLVRAKSHIQQLADGAVLAMAASSEKDMTKLKSMASAYLNENLEPKVAEAVTITSLKEKDEAITLTIASHVSTYFMSLANFNQLDVNALAKATRAVSGSVEVSLVLDNTYSMIEKDAKGVTKIAALKSAATTLVNELTKNTKADVKFAVVPYADYVNVGTGNRNETWLKVPTDTSTTSTRTCTQVTKSGAKCRVKQNQYACGTNYNDGVPSTAYCTEACPAESVYYDTYDPPKESCSGGTTTTKTFYGCIGSRLSDTVRLSDSDEKNPYMGFIDTSRRCPVEILPLTKEKGTVISKIGTMSENSSYKPKTYIPAGLIWGLNTLSPTAPYVEGKAYDPRNTNPRKVIVLMTDGENTMYYDATRGKDSKTGQHLNVEYDKNYNLTAKGQARFKETNDDTLTLCQNIRNKGIEIFTVALAVDSEDGKTIVQNCASGEDHYYDAAGSDALAAAFSDIAKSLSVVRLVQ